MRVIALRTLRNFWQQPGREDAEQPLRAWFREARKADWQEPAAIKEEKYRNASVLKAGGVVFNIAGNKYRLIVRVLYNRRIVYIRFIGTHAEYDKVDANKV